MKKVFTILIFLSLFGLSNTLFSQGTWLQKTSLPGNGRTGAFVFTIDSSAYIGGGQINSSGTYVSDFWEYNTTTDTWTQKASFGGGVRLSPSSFTLNNIGYVCCGFNGQCKNDVWSYNPTTNIWTQKNSFPSTARYGAFSFTIGNYAYLGKGSPGGPPFLSDFWKYDPTNDSWTQKTSFTSSINAAAIGFSINNKGYAGLGIDGNGNFTNEFYEYNPTTDAWTQKATYPSARNTACFVISNYAYVGTGLETGFIYTNNLWAYNPLLDTWTAIASVGSTLRNGSIAFSIGNKGYLGLGGTSSTYLTDLWEYTPTCPSVPATPTGISTLCQHSTNINYSTSDSTNVTDYMWSISPLSAGTISGTTNTSTALFNNTFYGTAYIKVQADNGTCASNYSDSIPITVIQSPTANITPNGVTTFCQGNSVVLNANTGINLFYHWQKNGTNISSATDSSYIANQTGLYSVIVTNINNCSTTSSSVNVTVVQLPTATITPSDTIIICQGNPETLNANTGAGLSYLWQLNGTNINGAIGSSCLVAQQGIYTVVVTNSNNCSTTSAPVNVNVNPSPSVAITAHGNTTFCQDSVLLTANYTAGLTYQWQKNNVNLNGATDTLLEVYQTGNYSVVVTNPYNCTATDNVTITVNPLPIANAGNDKNICHGDTVTLNATGGATYSWNNGVTQGVPFVPQTTSTYIVTVTTVNNCSAQDSLKITVHPLPPAPTITASGNALLSSSATGNQWFFNGNPISGATSQIYNAAVVGFYQVQFTDSNGCKSKSNIINITVGIEENEVNNYIHIYPNPTTDKLTIETNSNTEQRLEILNLIGQTVYITSIINKKATINTSAFANGVYILKLYSDKETVVRKFVKE